MLSFFTFSCCFEIQKSWQSKVYKMASNQALQASEISEDIDSEASSDKVTENFFAGLDKL